MKITYDPAKRAITLRERGLDFEDAAKVFFGKEATLDDERFDYGEQRHITAGFLDGRMVILVWTPRGASRNFYEARTCKRTTPLGKAPGLTRTMRRK